MQFSFKKTLLYSFFVVLLFLALLVFQGYSFVLNIENARTKVLSEWVQQGAISQELSNSVVVKCFEGLELVERTVPRPVFFVYGCVDDLVDKKLSREMRDREGAILVPVPLRWFLRESVTW